MKFFEWASEYWIVRYSPDPSIGLPSSLPYWRRFIRLLLSYVHRNPQRTPEQLGSVLLLSPTRTTAFMSVGSVYCVLASWRPFSSASSLPLSPLLRSISMAFVSPLPAHSSMATTSFPVLLFFLQRHRPALLSHLEAASLDEWLYNGGPYRLVVFHFLIGISAYMGAQ